MAIAVLLVLSPPAHAEAPAFADAGPLQSDTGHIMIAWSGAGPARLEMARTADFADAVPLYEGANHSYFLSGLADGAYYLRLSGREGAPSSTLRLTVAHQSLTQAFWLAGIGAIVTLAILITILRGARDE